MLTWAAAGTRRGTGLRGDRHFGTIDVIALTREREQADPAAAVALWRRRIEAFATSAIVPPRGHPPATRTTDSRGGVYGSESSFAAKAATVRE